MLVAPMARVAGHLVIAVEGVRVNAAHHFEHFARDYLFFLVIAGEVALDVTTAALKARARDKRAHYRPDLLLFDDREVLRRAHTAARAPAGRRSILCQQRNGANGEGCQKDFTHEVECSPLNRYNFVNPRQCVCG
jgi:hypothetical protein